MAYLQISHLNPPLTPPIHAVTTSSGIGSSTGFSNVTLTPEEEAAHQSLKDDLHDFIMVGDWEAVLYQYRENNIVQTAKITSSNETALHIAISDGRIDIVEELLKIIDAHVIREMTDHRKENPLHLAALLGQTKTCKLLVDKDPELIGARNIDGETPLFIAATHGKKGAFYALHPKCPITGTDIKHEIRHCKKKDGNTILHVSIHGEYFELAFQIINWYPELMEYNNEKGQTALHLLALNPSAFKSWSDMGLLDDFIYRCLIVDSAAFEMPSEFKEEQHSDILPILGNYKTCLDSLKRWKKVINAIVDRAWERKDITGNKDMEKQQSPVQSTSEDRSQATGDPNPGNEAQDRCMYCNRDHINASDLLFRIWKFGEFVGLPNQSSSWAFCRRFLLFAIELLLSVLRLGFFQVSELKKKKQKHTYAGQVMGMLVHYATDADSGSKPPTFDTNLIDPTRLPDLDPDTDHHPNPPRSSQGDRENKAIELMTMTMGKLDDLITRMTVSQEKILTLWAKSQEKDTNGKKTTDTAKSLMTFKTSDQLGEAKESTPFLVAAKTRVLEIVQGVMDHQPMAIHQEDVDKKNAVLLAVEYKHPRTYKLLRKRYSSHQSIFQKVDKNGNSLFHLAATTTEDHPWRIHGTALQIQWEIKWYNRFGESQFIKSSMPFQYFARRNNEGKTSIEVFNEAHKDMLKDGVQWLINTSQSCSVVAALIASVAYASATTVPGGLKEGTQRPAGIQCLHHLFPRRSLFISNLSNHVLIHPHLSLPNVRLSV